MSKPRAEVPGAPVDESPAAAAFQPAFPDLKWTGWEPFNDAGKANPLRLILLTAAGLCLLTTFLTLSRAKLHEMLRTLSRKYYPTARQQEIDAQLEETFAGTARGDAAVDRMLAVEHPAGGRAEEVGERHEV